MLRLSQHTQALTHNSPCGWGGGVLEIAFACGQCRGWGLPSTPARAPQAGRTPMTWLTADIPGAGCASATQTPRQPCQSSASECGLHGPFPRLSRSRDTLSQRELHDIAPAGRQATLGEAHAKQPHPRGGGRGSHAPAAQAVLTKSADAGLDRLVTEENRALAGAHQRCQTHAAQRSSRTGRGRGRGRMETAGRRRCEI
jgi:hypothetical protein